MMLTRSRVKSIGWAVILAVCFALTIALSFRVNAVRSQVRLAERHINGLKAEQALLETEFETRANQQQLTQLNEVEFGYQAPTAGQYLESERQLADLGKPRGPDAPPMIRVAANDAQGAAAAGDSVLPAMVNPLTGKALAAETSASAPQGKASAKAEPKLAERSGAASLADRLGHVQQLVHVEKSPKMIAPNAELRDIKAPSGKGSAQTVKVTAVAKAPANSTAKLAKAAATKATPGKSAAKPSAATTASKAPAKPVVRIALKPAAATAPGKAHQKVATD